MQIIDINEVSYKKKDQKRTRINFSNKFSFPFNFLFICSIILVIIKISSITSVNKEQKNIQLHSLLELNNINKIGLNDQSRNDNSNDTYPNQQDQKRKQDIDNSAGLIGVFFVFIIMAIYILIKSRFLPKDVKAYIKEELYLFIYIANNGFFISTLVDILYYKFTWEEFQGGYVLFIVCGVIFLFGGIYVIYKVVQLMREDPKIHKGFFSCAVFCILLAVPCDVLYIARLADDCCRSESYTVTYDQNGNVVSSGFCCHCFWNIFVYLFKLIILFITVLVYYFSLVFVFIGLIFVVLSAKCCCTPKEVEENNPTIESLVAENENENKDINANQNYNNENSNAAVNMNQIVSDNNPSNAQPVNEDSQGYTGN